MYRDNCNVANPIRRILGDATRAKVHRYNQASTGEIKLGDGLLHPAVAGLDFERLK